jgi:hypothetical protein
MPYNLWTDGLQDVDRLVRLFNQQQRSHEPMSGYVDGVNQYFYTQYTPILSSGSVYLYTSGSVPLAAAEYALDYSSGLVAFNTAPTTQPTISYQTARYSDVTMRSLLIAGFDEMELQWYRGLCLSETIGTLTLINETSGSAFITDSSGSAPYSVNGIPFENSRAQIGFYAKCVQLAYIKSLIPESALFGYLWAESGGLRVDKSMTTKNLKLALDALEADIAAAKQSVQFEWIGNALFGGAIATPYTADFVAHRWWQKDSIAHDYRNTQPYIGDRW